MMNPISLVTVLPAFFLAACAMGPDADTANSAAIAETDPRIGEEVDSICFQQNINGFEIVEGKDDAVILNRAVNDDYYVTLIGGCSTNRLRFAQRVAIDGRPSGGCVNSGDFLIFNTSVAGGFESQNTSRCAIGDIYRWREARRRISAARKRPKGCSPASERPRPT